MTNYSYMNKINYVFTNLIIRCINKESEMKKFGFEKWYSKIEYL